MTTVICSSGPLGGAPGWVGWVVVALVVAVLWVVPIVGTLALFPDAGRKRRHG